MNKYLERYAEPEVVALDNLEVSSRWANVLVIPACNESNRLLADPPAGSGRNLLILVINQTRGADEETSRNNESLASAIQKRFELIWKNGAAASDSTTGFELQLYRDAQFPRDILLVDRFSRGFELPQGAGVGVARKIGTDLAVSLIVRKAVRSPWILCSDGDVQLPSTYYTVLDRQGIDDRSDSALIYPFTHVAPPNSPVDADVMQATRLYELSLRYYAAGLRYADSPYAFHTIGSTLAVNATHYMQVRGFPRREAGEDFYLLNKLAKVGTVRSLVQGPSCAPIRIDARRSDRVPFGTGAAVNTITELLDPVQDFRFYHPAVFDQLKCWNDASKLIRDQHSGGEVDCPALLASVLPDHRDGRQLARLLIALGMGKAIEHSLRQSSSQEQFLKQLDTWFDAFRTLKLVHALRAEDLPSIPFEELIVSGQFEGLCEYDAELNDYFNSIVTSERRLVAG